MGEITSGTLTINPNLAVSGVLFFDPNVGGYNTIFTKSAMHEIGHGLGLEHYATGHPNACTDQTSNSAIMSDPCGVNDNGTYFGSTFYGSNMPDNATACDLTQLLLEYICYPPTPTPTPTPTPGGNPTWECIPYCQPPGLTDNSKSDGNTSNLIDSCCVLTPIVVDIDGDGFKLTSAENGVMFDFNGDGVPHRMSWTKRNSDEAWLVLDRNGNGTIDDGSEMFGNMTPQPQVDERHGFLALAEYDKIENGGNEDGKINKLDSIFSDLRLWQDKNHNGISEQSELKKLRRLDVKAFMLDYRTTNRVDRHGNAFRYKAKVRDTRDGNVGKWAWDVFLVLDEEENYTSQNKVEEYDMKDVKIYR